MRSLPANQKATIGGTVIAIPPEAGEANSSRWHNLHLPTYLQSHLHPMHHKLLEVESRLFNRNIIQLSAETNAGEYAENERNEK